MKTGDEPPSYSKPPTTREGQHGRLSLTRPEEDRLVASVGRFVIESYWPTVREGFFLFMATLLAFTLASAWAAREATLRDLRGQIVVLGPLAREVSRLAISVQDEERRVDAVRALASGSANSPTPCSTGFRDERGESVFKTPFWQAISTSDRIVIIEEKRYQELQEVYADVAAAPQMVAMDPEGCLVFLQYLEKKIDPLQNHLRSDIATAKAKAKKLDWLGSMDLWRSLLEAVLALVGMIALLPIVLHAARVTRSRRRVHPVAAAPPVPPASPGADDAEISDVVPG